MDYKHGALARSGSGRRINRGSYQLEVACKVGGLHFYENKTIKTGWAKYEGPQAHSIHECKVLNGESTLES